MTTSNQNLLHGQVSQILKAVNLPLSADTTQQFIASALKKTTTLGKLSPKYAKSATGSIPKITAVRDQIRSHQGLASTPTGSATNTASNISFTCKKVKFDTWVENDQIRLNSELKDQDVYALVEDMLSTNFGRDMQKLLFMGDTAHPTNVMLQIMDGFVKKASATTNILDLNAAAFGLKDFVKMKALLPEDYHGMNLRFFMSQNVMNHIELLSASRPTAFGDNVLINGMDGSYKLYNVPVEVVQDMSSDIVLLTPLDNFRPVYTYDARYQSVTEGTDTAAKDASYHIFDANMDAVVLELEGVVKMIDFTLPV